MAKTCPCGCGRNIDFGQRRMANRSLCVASLLPVVDRLRDRARTDEQRERWGEDIREGRRYRTVFLAIAHDEPSETIALLADAPIADLGAFRREADNWEARVLNLARRLRVEDPEWYATWTGPRTQF